MKRGLLFFILIFNYSTLFAQSMGDFRTTGNATFASATNWETYNGSSWVSAGGAPDNTDGVITILNGHTATVNADVTLDQVVVYGNLTISGSQVTFTLNDGSGTDLIIMNNGIVNMSVTSTPAGWNFSAGSPSWQIQGGGTYIHNTARAITSAYSNATLESGSTFIYRYSGTNPATTFAGKTYANLKFESTSGSWETSISQTSSLTINGTLTIGSDVDLDMSSLTGTLILNGNVNITGTLTSNSFEMASGKTLTVNSGGVLNINPDETITITGSIANNNGSSGIVLKSDATGTAELIHSGTIAGTVERFVPVASTAIQHFISAPVAGAKISSILDNSLGNYNAYKYDPSISGSIHDKWDRVFGSENMDFGIGYTIPYAHASTTAKTISFSGNMNTASNTAAISNTDGDWNLLGNPFTAPVSVSSFISANSSEIYGAVYYLDDNGAPYYTTDYAIHNGSGSTQAGANSKAGQANIAVGQGFFVKSNGGGSTVTFNPAWRTSGQSPLFFIPDTDPIQRVYLSVTDEQGAYNEILIGFTDFASKGFDNLYDAHKLKGNQSLALYSLMTDSDEEFAIQGRPYVSVRDTLKIGLDANRAGRYHFKLQRTENNPNDLKIYFFDSYLQKIVLLDEVSSYEVDLTVNSYKNRFYVVFSYEDLASVEARMQHTFNPIRINGSTIIVSDSIHNSEVSLLDILGRKIKSWNLDETKRQANLSNYKGCFIICLRAGNQKFFTKKIILP